MQDDQKILNVVLVEDDQEDALMFELGIDSLPDGFTLRHEKDGEKLFRLLRKFVPDIIFLDINLPLKTGIECITEIRQNKSLDNVPVIMYTSHSNEEYIQHSFSSGANFYLMKATSLSELAKRLKQIFAIDWKKVSYYPPRSQFVIDG